MEKPLNDSENFAASLKVSHINHLGTEGTHLLSDLKFICSCKASGKAAAEVIILRSKVVDSFISSSPPRRLQKPISLQTLEILIISLFVRNISFPVFAFRWIGSVGFDGETFASRRNLIQHSLSKSDSKR